MCDVLQSHFAGIGHASETDAKGNLFTTGGGTTRVLVTAHMDEIAMMVSRIEKDGKVRVVPLGGLHPWKCGEGLVQFLTPAGPVDGVLSFGSVHTNDPDSVARQVEQRGLTWDDAYVFIPESNPDIRPGTRVVIHPSRRTVTSMGQFLAGSFFDDRAALVSLLLTMSQLGVVPGVTFAATVSEEVGGEGALYLASHLKPEIIVALEIGPSVDDAPIELRAKPSVWVNDGYAAMHSQDLELLAKLAPKLQFQALTRGGSDASCAAAVGLCARPITLGLPVANSHGCEIMHEDAMTKLADLAARLIKAL